MKLTTTIYFLRLSCYALLGGVLAECDILSGRDWEFWVIMGLAVAIDVLSRNEKGEKLFAGNKGE